MSDDEPPHSNGEGGGDEASKKGEKKPAGMKEIGVRIAAIGNVVVQGINIGLLVSKSKLPTTVAVTTATQVGRGMVYGSSASGIAHSPLVAYNERQLTNDDTLRAAINGIREEQGRLAVQNDRLSAEIDDLQSEVDRMKDVEMALRELSETQGSQLDELMDLINENKAINNALRDVLKSKALEEVIGIVLDIDNDGSFTIENKEVDRLMISMKLIENIEFDDYMFRQEVYSCDGNVDEVIFLIKQMIHGSQDGEKKIDMDIDPDAYFEKQRAGSGR